MGLLSFFRRVDRKAWHFCYECIKTIAHEGTPDSTGAIFYYDGAPEDVDGRLCVRCPRCGDINTISFQYLKDTGQESQLWGLVRIVKKNPRDSFPVKQTA